MQELHSNKEYRIAIALIKECYQPAPTDPSEKSSPMEEQEVSQDTLVDKMACKKKKQRKKNTLIPTDKATQAQVDEVPRAKADVV